MTIGIYRGSFDPPHLGHFQTVMCALKTGIDRVVIIYTDQNKNKTRNQGDDVRLKLLTILFTNTPQVIISGNSFRRVVQDLVGDGTVRKISVLVGSDLLGATFRPMPLSEKLGCLVIPRKSFPVERLPETWNAIPVEMADQRNLVDLGASSSAIRLQLEKNQLVDVSKILPNSLLEVILSENFYQSRLRDVVEELLPGQQVSYHIENRGKSGDLVIVIRSVTQEGLLIAKIFSDRARFEREQDAFGVLSNREFRYVRVPRVRKIEEQMIVMDYADGVPFAELMQNSPESVSLCARANAELHSIRMPREKLEVDSQILEKIGSISSDAARRLEGRWQELSEAFMRDPGPSAMVHGDPNHFNWIVDLEKGSVTYIDFSNFSQNGFAMNEFYEAMLCFQTAAKRLGKIEKGEVQAIRELYEREYFDQIRYQSSASRDYFKGYWQLRVIESMLSRGKFPEKEILEFVG